ncbi:MAG: diaminopimelate epimerase [Pseudomonadota bacterium]
MYNFDFFKMSGSGNDFIIVDNRSNIITGDKINNLVKKICQRKISVGADGFILIQESDKADFKWRFFNADGSEAEMCGNGGRCAARFAYLKSIAGKKMSFETMAALIKAEILDDRVKLEMPSPDNIICNQTILIEEEEHIVNFINTGVPHVVKFVNDIKNCEVFQIGRLIRYHDQYKPAGANTNFAYVNDRSNMTVRTYERGVEEETLACGTGAVASVLIASLKDMVSSPVNVKTSGGETLTVHFKHAKNVFEEIFLEGDARVIYEGRLWQDAISQ